MEMLDTDSQCQLKQCWVLCVNLKGAAKVKSIDLIPNTSAMPRLNES